MRTDETCVGVLTMHGARPNVCTNRSLVNQFVRDPCRSWSCFSLETWEETFRRHTLIVLGDSHLHTSVVGSVQCLRGHKVWRRVAFRLHLGEKIVHKGLLFCLLLEDFIQDIVAAAPRRIACARLITVVLKIV